MNEPRTFIAEGYTAAYGMDHQAFTWSENAQWGMLGVMPGIALWAERKFPKERRYRVTVTVEELTEPVEVQQ